MKKLKQNGFSVVEILLVIIVVGLLGAVGWLVYSRQKSKTDSKNRTTQSSQQDQEIPKEAKSTPYYFKEFGLTMDLLDGWEVKQNHTNKGDMNFYEWTVEKVGADGKISLSSDDFRGGFSGCGETGDPLTAATVKEVAPTQNSNLMLMSWSYSYNNEANNLMSIVPTSEAVFRTTNNNSATATANRDVKPGNYFFCIAEPLPGFSLKLTSSTRKDRIAALASNSSDERNIPLPASAQSYADIKAMLTSIK